MKNVRSLVSLVSWPWPPVPPALGILRGFSRVRPALAFWAAAWLIPKSGNSCGSGVNRPQAVMLHCGKNVKSREELCRASAAVSTAGRSSTSPAIAAKCEKKQAAKPRMQNRRRRKAGERRRRLGRVGVHGKGDSAGFWGWQGGCRNRSPELLDLLNFAIRDNLENLLYLNRTNFWVLRQYMRTPAAGWTLNVSDQAGGRPVGIWRNVRRVAAGGGGHLGSAGGRAYSAVQSEPPGLLWRIPTPCTYGAAR